MSQWAMYHFHETLSVARIGEVFPLDVESRAGSTLRTLSWVGEENVGGQKVNDRGRED